ncbi:MAG: DMT family transporter [Halofilum sp. (in: g-proteobacteria)]
MNTIIHGRFSGALAGAFTVGLWGSLPVLRGLAQLPPMLVAATAMVSATFAATVLAHWRRPSATPAPTGARTQWSCGVAGLVGALYFYFLALESGDPAQVTLITYMWPLGFVLLCDRLAGRGLRLATLFGAAIAFAGVAPLLMKDAAGLGMTPLAFASGLASGAAWILFSMYLRQVGGLSPVGYRRMFLRAGLVALALHLLFEQPPGATQLADWLAAGLIGLGPYGLAFIAWGYALRQGPATLLGVMTYAVPIVSATLLVLLGWTAPSAELLIAAAAVCAGALVSESPWRRASAA